MSYQKIVTSIKTFGIFVSVTLFSFIIYLFIPVAFICSVPFLLYRWCVSKYAVVMKSDTLGKMLNAKGCIMTMGNAFETPKNVIVVPIVLEGTPDIDHFRNLVQTNLIDAKNTRGEVKFPELRQTLVKWMGFYFWKNVSNFNLEEHVYIYNNELHPVPLNTNTLLKYHVDKWWSRDKALWELVIVQGDCTPLVRDSLEDCFLLMVRFHHGLMDGYSGIRFLQCLNTVVTSSFELPLESKSAKSSASDKWLSIPPFLKAPWEFSYNLLFSPPLQSNPFGMTKELSGTFCRAALRIPLAELKEVKNSLGISFTSAFAAIAAGGLHNFFPPGRFGKGISFQIPLFGKPSEKLRNTVSFVKINVQVGEPDRLKRALNIHQEISAMKSSTYQCAVEMLTILGGCIPPDLLSPITYKSLSDQGVVVSNVPTPVDWEICGHAILDLQFATSVAGTGGIVFGATTQLTNLVITVGADAAFIPSDEDAVRLLNLCYQELSMLRNLEIRSNDSEV